MAIETPELTKGIREGDPQAQRLVVETYLPQVMRASRAAGLDPATAEDAAQSTFLTFFEKAATFEGRSQVRTWLFGILYLKIKEARRAGSREILTDEIEVIVDRRFSERGNWAMSSMRQTSEPASSSPRAALRGGLLVRSLPIRRDQKTCEEHQANQKGHHQKILEALRLEDVHIADCVHDRETSI